MNDIESARDILREVRRVEIRSRHLVSNAFIGAYHSCFKGHGLHFEEIREYVEGDDVRTIDWSVSAKMGRPFVKKYAEERALTIMLVVDVSASTHFGSFEKNKKYIIAQLASVLAFSANANNDKVGLILFSDRVELYIPPKKGRKHILRIIRDILFFLPKSKKTQIDCSLEYLDRLVKERSIVFLLSDFLSGGGVETSDDLLRKRLSVAQARHDVICIQLVDKVEAMMPRVGIVTMVDAESNRKISVNTLSNTFIEQYQRLHADYCKRIKESIIRSGCEIIVVDTHKDIIKPLKVFFENRKK